MVEDHLPRQNMIHENTIGENITLPQPPNQAAEKEKRTVAPKPGLHPFLLNLNSHIEII